MALQKIGSSGYPVSLADAKLHLRVEHDSENSLINALIGAATVSVSNSTGRALMPETWNYTLEEFPADDIILPIWPAIAVTEITYTDEDDVEQTLDPEDYTLEDNVVSPVEAWPTATDVVITFTAGYAGDELDSPPGANGVPEPLKQAILLLIGHWYASREAVTAQAANEVPMAVQYLINPYRRAGTFFA